MSSPADDEEQAASFKPFTKAERIQQLNDIDKIITQVVQSAGLALKTLSVSRSDPTLSPPERRETFETASNSFLKNLQKVDVGLKRQIFGLEEANIIPADVVKKGKDSQGGNSMGGMRPKVAPAEQPAGESGMGKLDIGWLNSRSGRVGRDMEAELWEKAKVFLDGSENGDTNWRAHGDPDVDMT